MPPTNNEARLDAVETAWFARENETINKTLYETIYPANKARQLIPDEAEARGCGKVYTWGMVKNFGEAKEITNAADDLPRAGTSVGDQSRIVKMYGASYGWDLMEIKEAARTGRPLEMMEANAARLACDNKLDALLALGDGVTSFGLLNQTNTTAWTLGTKSGGGKTWANATPKEIVKDIATGVGNLLTALKQNGNNPFTKFQVVLPSAQDTLIATTPMGDGIDKTIKQYILDTMKENISGIDAWDRCVGAGAGVTDRIVMYPKDPLVLGAVVAEEFTITAPQQKNLSYLVNCYFRCGGVVLRYTVAMAYGDGC
jgi:hypothetical protein